VSCSHAGRDLFAPLVVEAEPLLGDAKVLADCLYRFQEQFPQDGEDLRGVGPGALFAGRVELDGIVIALRCPWKKISHYFYICHCSPFEERKRAS
jgi:hypothetical protein